MEKYSFKDFALNKSFDLGTIILSEQDIIDFAKRNDPLEFHINKEAALKSIFKGLVSSGPQLINAFHMKSWVHMFGHSVLCGLEINNWKFLKPVYANQPIKGKVTIIYFKPNPEKKHCVVTWRYEFTDEKSEFVQTLEITVMHSMAA
jgi:acyl dehydratase